MNKRTVSLFLSVIMIISLIPLSASAKTAEPQNAIYSGTCGDDMTCTLDTDTGVLTPARGICMITVLPDTRIIRPPLRGDHTVHTLKPSP